MDNLPSYAESRGRALRLGMAFFSLLAADVIVQYIASFCVSAYAPDLAQTDWYPWLLTLLPLYVAALPCCLLLLRRCPAEPDRPNRVMRVRHWLLALVIALGLMFIGNLIGQLLMLIVSLLRGTTLENPIQSMLMETNPVWSAISTVIVAPIGEEFIFRRLIIDRARRFGEMPAVLLSALMFGAFHLNFYQFFYAFFLGLVFGYIYVKTGRLRYTVALHAAINFLGGVIAPALIRHVLPLLETLDDPAALLSVLPALLLYLAYSALLAGSALTTVILGIVLHRRITFVKSSESTRPLWLNLGALAFFALCALLMIASMR